MPTRAFLLSPMRFDASSRTAVSSRKMAAPAVGDTGPPSNVIACTSVELSATVVTLRWPVSPAMTTRRYADCGASAELS